MHSLQGKIVLVYLALATLAVCLSLLALVELRLMATKVEASSQVAEFFDTTLEVRRFEKNHFLYGQPQDLAENRRYTALALDLLEREPRPFAALVGEPAVALLQGDLRRYANLMAGLAWWPEDDALAVQVRALGNAIVTAGEDLARLNRQGLREALDAYQRNLIVSIAAVVALLALAGVLLARWVTQPLKIMETRMEAVAHGSLTRLEPDVRERELASLGRAFNHVLDELERRQRNLVRSEKLASLGTLLSGVAHELNNPISNISASAQILAAEPDAAAEFRHELLVDIDQESRRAARIVRSLLDYSRERGLRLATRCPLRTGGRDLGFSQDPARPRGRGAGCDTGGPRGHRRSASSATGPGQPHWQRLGGHGGEGRAEHPCPSRGGLASGSGR